MDAPFFLNELSFMTAVLSYWQVPDEEQDFLCFLQSTGSVVALPSHAVKTKAELKPERLKDFIEKHDPLQLEFGLPHLLSEADIEQQQFGQELLYKVATMRPCLIGYNRPKFWAGELGRSNLSAYWDYSNREKSKLIQKSPEFVKWAKTVFSWARKRACERIALRGCEYPATRRARDAFLRREFDIRL
jgi:hypothetical protein